VRARARSRSRGEAGAEVGGRGLGRNVPPWVVLLAAVGLGAFVVGYAATALLFRTAGAPADVVLVPDVREMTVAEATRAMESADLSLAVGDSLPNAEIPQGAVLAQSPLPGQEVSPGTEVRVIVSSGHHRTRVPAIATMPVPLATRALEAAGFEVLIEEAPGEGTVGGIVGVDPAPGTAMPLPATVVLRVGAPSPYREMPYLIGMHEDSARGLLQRMGLYVAEILYESSDDADPEHVIHQVPSPGDTIESGGDVRLRVTGSAAIRGELRGAHTRRLAAALDRMGERQ
jgi:eukaryotic-like serine/threonine-protein kinase